MNGVTIPGVSAGSNHVGASEMWTPQVTWPSGAAAAGTAAAAEISRTRTVTKRRGFIMSLQPGGSMGHRTMGAGPPEGRRRAGGFATVRLLPWRIAQAALYHAGAVTIVG